MNIWIRNSIQMILSQGFKVNNLYLIINTFLFWKQSRTKQPVYWLVSFYHLFTNVILQNFKKCHFIKRYYKEVLHIFFIKRILYVNMCLLLVAKHQFSSVYYKYIKLMTGKALRKHSLHEKTAASVLLKLFISINEWCHTTDAP